MGQVIPLMVTPAVKRRPSLIWAIGRWATRSGGPARCRAATEDDALRSRRPDDAELRGG